MRIIKPLAPIAAVLILLSLSISQAQPTPSAPYVWHNVVIGGGGFVTGIIFHPTEKKLLYARTDVGGAYRSEDSGKHWTPITDWIVGYDLTGIESFAIDPMDANRIYLAAGIYSHTRAAILRSADRGRTWRQTEVPFKMGGNEAGRFDGERLAVDPHDGRILFFGSRHDGLWRSVNYGRTWNKVKSFPQIDEAEPPPTTSTTAKQPPFLNQEVGIVFVQFDPHSGVPGQRTPVIYAGASIPGTNFFRSDDAGNNWTAVPGQPLGFRPNHAALSPDGTIYLSYGREAGPNTMGGGAIWKFIPATGAWTDITPPKSSRVQQSFGYGAVAVNQQRPEEIVATTFARWRPRDEIFRSINGGAEWKPLLQNAEWDFSNAPYTAKRVPHWMGTIQIDPFDSNRVLFTTGYGIWSCENLTDADSGKPTQWNFSDTGFEETVPLALISPPDGAHLLSGLGDIDGFRHDDLDVSPAQGTFAGPRFSNTEDLAFAGKNSSIMVRTGTGTNNVHAAISTNGGKNWNALFSEPSGNGGGTIAVSADGSTIVWTSRRGWPNFSNDNGKHWKVCAGLATGLRVIADPVNPSRFYTFNAQSGKFLTSTNGAESFFETTAAFPGTNGAPTLAVTPDREGDLWLSFRNLGLYHSTDGGANFTKIKPVDGARYLGFGKSPDGKNFPTLFLAGKIRNIEGLFRSTDAGVTWTRINDDQHQYGTISRVTGDPRILGRVYFATSGRGIIYGDEINAK